MARQPPLKFSFIAEAVSERAVVNEGKMIFACGASVAVDARCERGVVLDESNTKIKDLVASSSSDDVCYCLFGNGFGSCS